MRVLLVVAFWYWLVFFFFLGVVLAGLTDLKYWLLIPLVEVYEMYGRNKMSTVGCRLFHGESGSKSFLVLA